MVTKTPLRITMETLKQEANEFSKRSRDYALGTLLFMVIAMGIGYIPIVGSVALVLSASIGLGGVLVTRMGTRIYAPGKASVAVAGDEQQVFTPADPVTR